VAEAQRGATAEERAEATHAWQAAGPAQAAETSEGEVMTSKFRDALVVGLAQNAILAGLIILAAGVPTW